jgi:hypothetical protein
VKTLYSTLIFVLSLGIVCFAKEQGLLIDDFENTLSGGPSGTVDFGAGGGSTVEVSASTDTKYSGKQSIKIVYNAVAGGYMWVARGFELDVKNADWLIKPQAVDWKRYTALSFYMYGSDSKARIAFDIKDKGNELWRFMVDDNFKGWKKIICPFKEFFVRTDWQPNSADKNSLLDFPLKNFQFEPRPVAKGTLYFDTVALE